MSGWDERLAAARHTRKRRQSWATNDGFPSKMRVQSGRGWGRIEAEQFRRGLEVELEHGARDPDTDVTHDDLTLTGKIAWAHLKEIPDYDTRLDRLEAEAGRPA